MLYNIYRPKNFSEIKGQEDVLITLKKQAKTGKFAHAYLLSGHRGTGKTTIARILAKSINCENPSENGPCGKCQNCLNAANSLDIRELDAATNNGVEQIKELTGQAKYRPVQLKNKVFIIDEVHNLSTAAFDVLLKPLEEPPSYCTFILCTTEVHKIPVTIRSRCEVYTFHPIAPEPMKERIREVLTDQHAVCEEDALNLIVRNANGGMRDALGILEQLITSTDARITTDDAKKLLGVLDTDTIVSMIDSIINYDTSTTLTALDLLFIDGKSPSLITDTMLNVLTDMITIKTTQNPQSVMHSKEYCNKLWATTQNITFNRLYWLCEQCCDLRNAFRGSANPALDIRLALIRLSHQEITSNETWKLAEELSMVKKELQELKQRISLGMPPEALPNIPTGPAGSETEESLKNVEDYGFFEVSEQDIPFTAENPFTDPAETFFMEKDTTKKGGMPTDSIEADAYPTDALTDASVNEASTPSILFKILWQAPSGPLASTRCER